MYITLDKRPIAGRIRKVRSTQLPGVWHWGIEDWTLDVYGRPLMWHAQKNDVLRRTGYEEFSSGQPSEIVWTPQTRAQQHSVIQRLKSIEGTPWNLATANCEQIIRWAVEGRAYSEQLAIGVGIAFFAGLGAVALFASRE